jgi:uncharacterized protein
LRVLISGASGLIGSALTRELRAAGHETVALVRHPAGPGEVQWNPRQVLDPAKLAGFDAVVHLAGKNVAGIWTPDFKREILESRVWGTLTLAGAAAASYIKTGKPRVFVSASGMSYYGNRADEVLTEDSSPGPGFLADVVRQWEAATSVTRDAGLRTVSMRVGVVLSRNGGALKPMLAPFKLGLGGRVGNGQQWWSWIALDDVVGAMRFAIENETLQGPVNTVGPAPVRNAEFVRALGHQLHRPAIVPLPEFVIRTLMGEMGHELLLVSARVLPAKLNAAGYKFRYANLPDALAAALR